MAQRYGFYVRVTETVSFLAKEKKIHIFEPTCNVLFIIRRPDVVDIADFFISLFLNNVIEPVLHITIRLHALVPWV